MVSVINAPPISYPKKSIFVPLSLEYTIYDRSVKAIFCIKIYRNSVAIKCPKMVENKDDVPKLSVII